MPQSFNDLIFLSVLYLLAYGAGILVSKLWNWLSLLVIIVVVGSFLASLDFKAINIPNILVLVIPIAIFAYPTFKATFAFSFSIPNPITWLLERIDHAKYMKLREKEQELERENLERAERILRMQAEEAERQRQFEREKAEREAREREEQQKREQAKNEERKNQDKNSGGEQEGKSSKASNNKNLDPYEVLGVSRDMKKSEIRQVYLDLMLQYAPDRVAHLSKEFQKMAHEKCVVFNLAWEKIKKEK